MTRFRQDDPTAATAEQRGLLGALHAEYAAVYAYGLIAAYSKPDRQDMITSSVAAHRARRDQLVGALRASGVTEPAAAGYSTPFPVADPIAAAKLAVTVENDTATAWLAALQQAASPATRRTCVDALTEAALRLADWRHILGITPPSTPFPGQSQ